MIPEPTTGLWLWLRKFWDTNIWPQTDEDAAQRMGDNWHRLSVALQTSIDQANTANSSATTVWLDGDGDIFHEAINQNLNHGLNEAVGAFEDVATMCWNLARSVAQIKDQIYSELAWNALFFALTFALPPGIGDLVRWRLVAGLATRFSSMIRAAAGLVEHAGGSLPRALGRLTAEAFREGLEEIGTELTAQKIDQLRGFRPGGIDWKQVAVAGTAGVIGSGIAPGLNPIGRLGTAPANRVSRALDLGDRGTTVLNQSGHAFVVNGISSPISSVAAQSIIDGNWANLVNIGAYGEAIVNGGLTAGVLGASRIGSVHAGDALGQTWSGNLRNSLGMEQYVAPGTPPGGGPNGPTPATPAVSDAGGVQSVGGAGNGSVGGTGSGSLAGGAHGADGSPARIADHHANDTARHGPGHRQADVQEQQHNTRQSAETEVEVEHDSSPELHAEQDVTDIQGEADPGQAPGSVTDGPPDGGPPSDSDTATGQAPADGNHVTPGAEAAADVHGLQDGPGHTAATTTQQSGDVQTTTVGEPTVAAQATAQPVAQQGPGATTAKPPAASPHNSREIGPVAEETTEVESRNDSTLAELPAKTAEIPAETITADAQVTETATAEADAATVDLVVGPDGALMVAAPTEPAAKLSLRESAREFGKGFVEAMNFSDPHAKLRGPADGNAEKLGDFVADGPVRDHAEVWARVVELLNSPVLLAAAGVVSIVVDGGRVTVTPIVGDPIVVTLMVGRVADGHPAEFTLTGQEEFAVVRISEQIKDADIGRAVVHELRELSRLASGQASQGPAFDAHEQGRLGELLLLHGEALNDQEALRAAYAAKMRELVADVGLERSNEDERLAALNDEEQVAVRRAVAFAGDPVPVQEFGWFNADSPVVEETSGPTATVTPWVSSGDPRNADPQLRPGHVEELQVGPNWARWVVDAVTGAPRIAQAVLHADFGQLRRPSADRIERKRAVARGKGRPGAGKDDGGHAIAWRFFAKVMATMNYFPQASSFNRGAFESLENEIGDWIAKGWRVDLKVFFPPNEPRPSSVTVVYAVSDPANPEHVIWTGARTWENTAVPHRAELTGPGGTRDPVPTYRPPGVQKQTNAQYQRYQRESIDAFDPDRSNLFEPDEGNGTPGPTSPGPVAPLVLGAGAYAAPDGSNEVRWSTERPGGPSYLELEIVKLRTAAGTAPFEWVIGMPLDSLLPDGMEFSGAELVALERQIMALVEAGTEVKVRFDLVETESGPAPHVTITATEASGGPIVLDQVSIGTAIHELANHGVVADGDRVVIGNAERLGVFAAVGEVKEHEAVWTRIAAELGAAKLAQFVDAQWIQIAPDGRSLLLQPWSGDPVEVQLRVGEVRDGHPAEVKMRHRHRLAVVTISERIEFADVGRALVHELREAGHAFGGPVSEGQQFSDHQQGRVGELLYLDHQRRMAETAGRQLESALSAERMREVLQDLGIQRADDGRVDRLERQADRVAVRRAAAATDAPTVPIPVDQPTVPIPVDQPTVPIPVDQPTVPIPVDPSTTPIPVDPPTTPIPVEPPTVEFVRGEAKSLLFLDGARRFFPAVEQVEYLAAEAMGDPRVLAAAGIAQVVPVGVERYRVVPVLGDPFEVIVRAAKLPEGVAGEFVAYVNSTSPATMTVSSRAPDAIVERIVANLLHQLSRAAEPVVPNVLAPGSEVKRPSRLSREDGGRLAEVRLLNDRMDETSVYHAVRRMNLRNAMRALLESMAIVSGQDQAGFRRASLPASDAPMIERHLRGWSKNDDRVRLRVYLAREMTFSALPPALGASAAIAIVSGNVLLALGLGLPALAAAAANALGQRWLDGHKKEVKGEATKERLGEVRKRLPSLRTAIEADPYGVAGEPLGPIDKASIVPAKWRYVVKAAIPAVAAIGTALALSPLGVPTAGVIIAYSAMALIKPFTERYLDSRKAETAIQRAVELEIRHALDPTSYRSQLLEALDVLRQRVNGGRGVPGSGRADRGLPSIGPDELAATELADQVPTFARRFVPVATDPRELDPTPLSQQLDTQLELLILGAISGVAGGLMAGGVEAKIQRLTDLADAGVSEFHLKAVSDELTAELHAEFAEVIDQLSGLADVLEGLRAGEVQPDQAMERLRARLAGPSGPSDVAPSGEIPAWAHAMHLGGPLITAGTITLIDAMLGLDPAAFAAAVATAGVQALGIPAMKWWAEHQTARNREHERFAGNKEAINRADLADQMTALRYVLDRIARDAGAAIESVGPTVELAVPSTELSAFTDRVRAAVRAARLAVVPTQARHAVEPAEPRSGFQERVELHVALDEIESQADLVDELAAAGAATGLAEAGRRLEELLTENAVHPDQRVRLPGLEAVDPANGQRIEGNPLAQTKARAAEAWRRLVAEPETAPERAKRTMALGRVRHALDTLEYQLARAESGHRQAGVKLALTEVARTIAAFKLVQRGAWVADTVPLDYHALRHYVADRLLALNPTALAAAITRELPAATPNHQTVELPTPPAPQPPARPRTKAQQLAATQQPTAEPAQPRSRPRTKAQHRAATQQPAAEPAPPQPVARPRTKAQQLAATQQPAATQPTTESTQPQSRPRTKAQRVAAADEFQARLRRARERAREQAERDRRDGTGVG
ncbi:DNA/RNA non-specific endonuclease [Kribbella sp. NPDC056951]|uniref:WXG100-like domain-containing protein n=1 Tax=Kribbella sp. NPDC056951 TaxID=3345978 RepID=UPI003628521F